MALADLMLKPNGKIAAVVPINIARGKATEKIRDYLLKNYYIKYIVKSTVDKAFSEKANFRDILLVAEKRKPCDTDKTIIILLKQSIQEGDLETFQKIARSIRELEKNDNIKDENFEYFIVDYKKLKEHKDNLMPFLAFTSTETQQILVSFLNLLKKSPKISYPIKSELLIEGFHASPKGLSELTFITSPSDKSRIEQAFLILEKKEKQHVTVQIKNTNISIEIDIDKINPALRTITGIDRIDITNNCDWLISDKFEKFEIVRGCSSWKGKFSWKMVKKKMKNRNWHLAIPSRFRMNSKNTKVIAVYCDNKFYAPHTFKMVRIENKEKAKMYGLILNSVLFLINFIFLGSQTTLGYTDLRESDLVNFILLDPDKLNRNEQQQLLNLFEEIRSKSFPSIIEQLEQKCKVREKIDKAILQILGFSDKEIEDWLPKIYSAIVKELKTN